MESKSRILATGTMRTGGSLLSNVMCAHSKIFVFGERFHFFRFCYNRYNPLTEKSVNRLLEHQRLRLLCRFKIDFDVDVVFMSIKKRGLTYPIIFDEGMKFFLTHCNRSIWGEYTAMQWRDIPAFVQMFPNSRAIHLYRDPRSVLSSWKRLSFAPSSQYLNPIFNWIDSMNCVKRYSDELSNEKYLPLSYESIMKDPRQVVEGLCKFVNVDFEEEMLLPETWHARLPQNMLINPRSAHEGQNIRGFSTSRTQNWKKNLEEWEIALVEHLCHDLMEEFGYDFYKDKYSISDIKKGFDMLGSDPLMLQRLSQYLSSGEGSHLYVNDPTDPNSWAAARHDIAGKFTDSEEAEAQDYVSGLVKIEADLKKKYGGE